MVCHRPEAVKVAAQGTSIANEYFSSVYGSLQKAMAKSPNASEETVAIIAPFFANGGSFSSLQLRTRILICLGADKGKGYPWTDGLPAGEGSVGSIFS